MKSVNKQQETGLSPTNCSETNSCATYAFHNAAAQRSRVGYDIYKGKNASAVGFPESNRAFCEKQEKVQKDCRGGI